MKSRRIAAAALFALAVVVALAADAATPRPGPLLRRVIARLELTPEQVEQIRTVLEDHADELRSEARAVLDAREAMFETIHAATPSDAAILAAAKAVGDAEGTLALTRADIVAEVREVLTDEQEAELAEIAAEARERIEDALERLLAWAER